MKIFSNQFWGTVLIWIGVILFITVIYDSIRPYFPPQSSYPWVRKSWVGQLFSSSKKQQARQSRSTRQKSANHPLSYTARVRDDGFLTTNVYETKGNYHLWVWGVLPEKKTGETVEVKIAHAAAGKQGGFWIVAFADTDGDGEPDREIARSDYLTSQAPGKWSSFKFKTKEKNIFVGNTWPKGSNTWVYRYGGLWPSSDDYPFESRGGRHAPLFYHTISPREARSAGPGITNMQISFSD